MMLSIDKFPTDSPSVYAELRSEIRSGDILLACGSGWFSRMIQRATGSVWSHVAFVMRLQALQRVMVLESVEPVGVRTVPLSKYLEDYDSQGNPYPGGIVLARHAHFEKYVNMRELGQFALSLFGYPYDKNEIAKIAARVAASHLPFSDEERRELEPDREYICSEYVHACYHRIGLDIKHDQRGFIAPADFARDEAINLVAVLKSP